LFEFLIHLATKSQLKEVLIKNAKKFMKFIENEALTMPNIGIL
jgi:hypothetical protein